MTMSRRHLIAGAAALAIIPCRASAAAVDEAEALLALLPDRNAAAKLGENWVEQEQPQAQDVLQNLQQRLGGGDAVKLHDVIAADFRAGAIVKVEGWQIARTQAELCALAYYAKVGSLERRPEGQLHAPSP